ncbi:hypothetical protein [Elioraea sp.]|uniref:hypothetical protein n=1 Tax=Elioraea sp. TaxID=2185103 RepID=UPI003F6E4703
MSYEERIVLAEATIDKLAECVGAVSANRGTALITDALGLTDHATPVAQVYAIQPTHNDWGTATDPAPHFIAMTVQTKHGNCDMKAELVYQSIRNRPSSNGVVNTKMCRVFIPGHAFCILCDQNLPNVPVLPATTNTITDFGADAVVVDLWQEDYWTPNTWLMHGKIPGPERAVWRHKIKNNPITVIRSHTFVLN